MAECKMLLRCVGLVQNAAASNEASGRVACVSDVQTSSDSMFDLSMCFVEIAVAV